jgi:flagellar basal body-associated protein FliL
MSAHDPAPKKGKMLIVFVVLALVSIGAGAVAPTLLLQGSPAKKEAEKHKESPDSYIQFGDLTVNLADGRGHRYLRVKVVIVTDEASSKHLTEVIEQKKATLRNWLITHLSDKTLKDVQGRVAINRIRREMLDYFTGTLSADGKGHLRDVLFDEFVVQ